MEVSYHPVRFGGHRHCGRGDIMEVSYHPVRFGGHRHCGDIMTLVCHVILQD